AGAGDARRRLYRLPRPVRRRRPGPGLPDPGHLRAAPVRQELAVALQAGGVPAALRLGQLRRLGGAEAGRRRPPGRRPGRRAGGREELARAAEERLRRGFRDNTWLLCTRGTDYELAPPAAGRATVVRTLYAEADGAALPDPDPGDPKNREFAWMTALRSTPDR